MGKTLSDLKDMISLLHSRTYLLRLLLDGNIKEFNKIFKFQNKIPLKIHGSELRGADLSKAKLCGVDFSHANLSRTKLYGANLLQANLTSANLEHADLSANLIGSDLSHANLKNAKCWGQFQNAKLQDADLQGADLLGFFSNADFSGANLSYATINGSCADTKFSKANLFKAVFQGHGTALTRADCSDTNLENATLQDIKLESTNLSHANLRNANLSHSYLSTETFPVMGEQNVKKAQYISMAYGPEAFQEWSKSKFRSMQRNFEGAILFEANLSGANLSGANLSGANLSLANLDGANFQAANLSDTNFARASMNNTNFHKSTLFEARNLPRNYKQKILKRKQPWKMSLASLVDVLNESLITGDYEEARAISTFSLRHIKNETKSERAAILLFTLGQCYEAEQDWNESYKFYNNASKACPRNVPTWNIIQMKLADFFRNVWNRPKDSKFYSERVNLDVLRSVGGSDLVQFYLDDAYRQYSDGNYDGAISIVSNEVIPKISNLIAESNRKATGKFEPSIDLKDMVSAHLSLSRYTTEKFFQDKDANDFDGALRALSLAYAYTQTPYEEMEVLNEIAELRLRAALGLNDGRINIPDESVQSMTQQAKSAVEEVLSFKESRVDKNILMEATIALARCYALLEEKDKAEEYFKRGIEICDQVIASERTSDLRIDLTFTKKLNSYLSEFSSFLLSMGREKEALGYIEISKAREIFNVDVIKSQVDCEKRRKSIDIINTLNNDLNEVQSKIWHLEAHTKTYRSRSSMLEEISKLNQEYSRIFEKKRETEYSIWKDCPDPGISLPKKPEEVIDRFTDIMKSLVLKKKNDLPRWALLEFNFVRNKQEINIFLLDCDWSITVSKSKLELNDWNKNMPDKVNQFREAIIEKDFNEAQKILQENAIYLKTIIAKSILEKIRQLKPEILLIVADGILHSMPFELIIDEDGLSKEFWGIKYKLVRGFSMTHFSSQLQRQKRINSNTGLIVGNPTDMAVPKTRIDPLLQSDNLWNASLKGAEEEAKSIAKLFRHNGGKSVLLLKDKGSEDRFLKEANARPYLFVHFAGHAKFDSDEPDQSYLLLRKEEKIDIEKLYANEIATKIHLRESPVVTISSCESGTSEVKTGDEAFGLIRGLTIAGASNLILSGWPVFDESAKEFMEIFYSSLFEGHSISYCIGYARWVILNKEQNGTYANKAGILHWSAFQLWGNPLTVVAPKKI